MRHPPGPIIVSVALVFLSLHAFSLVEHGSDVLHRIQANLNL